MYTQFEAYDKLMNKIADMTCHYLLEQFKAGAQIVQILIHGVGFLAVRIILSTHIHTR